MNLSYNVIIVILREREMMMNRDGTLTVTGIVLKNLPRSLPLGTTLRNTLPVTRHTQYTHVHFMADPQLLRSTLYSKSIVW